MGAHGIFVIALTSNAFSTHTLSWWHHCKWCGLWLPTQTTSIKSIRIERIVTIWLIFSLRNGCEIWYNKRMAKQNTTEAKDGDRLRSRTRRKQAIRMLISLELPYCVDYCSPQTQRGRCHSLQSLFDWVVEFGLIMTIGTASSSYLSFQMVHKQRDFCPGSLYLQLACSWFLRPAARYGNGLEQSVLKGTLSQVADRTSDWYMQWLASLRWACLVLDSISPYPFLFSNIGSYFIGEKRTENEDLKTRCA